MRLETIKDPNVDVTRAQRVRAAKEKSITTDRPVTITFGGRGDFRGVWNQTLIFVSGELADYSYNDHVGGKKQAEDY